MVTTLKVVDDFYPFPEELRACALALPDKDEEFDGHVYHGWRRYEHDGFVHAMSAALSAACLNPVRINLHSFVAAKSGFSTAQWIHADPNIGAFACVLHLHHKTGGTAHWRHLETGEDFLGPAIIEKLGGPQEASKRLQADGEFQERWQMTNLAGAKFNRIAIYPSQIFHSRYPKQATGETDEDCRLTWVAFFDIDGGLQ